MAYGICLCARVRNGGGGERGHVLAEDGEEARVEPREALFAREAHEARGEPGRVAALRDEPDTRCLERGQQDVGEEPARAFSIRPRVLSAGCGTHSATEDAPRYIAVRCATAASWLPAIWTNCFFQYS